MTRKIKRGGKVWINVYPDKPFTKKPAETRMGSGKGSPEGWVAVVKPGRVMFELAGVPEPLAREAMRLAGHKLPVRTKFVHARGRLMMKPAELRDMSDAELREHIATARRELFGLRFQHATGELDNTAGPAASEARVARALTVAARARTSRESEPMADETETDAENADEDAGAPEAAAAETAARRGRRAGCRARRAGRAGRGR